MTGTIQQLKSDNTASAHFRLGLLRLVLLVICAVNLIFTPYANMAILPNSAASPAGWSHLLFFSDGLMDILLQRNFLLVLQFTGIVFCISGTLSSKFDRWLLPALTLIVFLLDAVIRAYSGFLNHAQLATLYMLLFITLIRGNRYMGVSGLFRQYFREKDVSVQKSGDLSAGVILRLMMCVLIIPYTYIALNRILMGGVEVFLGDSLAIYLATTGQMYSNYGINLAEVWLGNPVIMILFKTGFAITTVFELLSVFTLVSRRFRLYWVIVITGFHLVTLVTMNIFFWENMLLVLVLFAGRVTGDSNFSSNSIFFRKSGGEIPAEG